MTSRDASLLPAPADPSDAGELSSLYRSWGILELLGETVDRLPRAWLEILNIARNLLEGRPIPGVTVPAGLVELTSRAGDIVYERRKVTITHRRPGQVLPDEPEVRPIESVAEFPRIVAGQRMWQFIDPEIFFYRLYTHDVLVKERQPQAVILDDEEEETVEEVEIVARPRRRPRQRVLLLRDTSSSMRDSNKGIFAKAVALAYLVKAFEEGAEIGDRSFANTVHPRLRARTREEFGAIARRVLREGYYGTTNLAAALEVTMAEIRREELGLNPNAQAKTEILLISDCENPVELPLLPPGVSVNTLHLEGGREGLMLADYQARLREIQEISRLFVRIDTAALQLPDTTREAWLVLEDAASAARELAGQQAAGGEVDPALAERAHQAERLTTAYERMARRAKDFQALKARFERGRLGGERADGAFVLALWQLVRRLWSRWFSHSPRPTVIRPAAPSHPAAPGGIIFRPK